MDIVLTAIAIIIMFAVLVVTHEWGHFIAARLFQIRVDEFSIGFGKLVWTIGKRGDTQYNVRLIPLGGYVKIAGMEADEEPLNIAKEKAVETLGVSSDSAESTDEPLVEPAEPIVSTPREPADDEFYAKPVWQRAIVIAAGPIMSLVLGIFIFCNMGWISGAPVITNHVGEVLKDGEAARIGMKAGDAIVRINDTPIVVGEDCVRLIHSSCGKLLVLTIRRDGKTIVLQGTPRPLNEPNGKPYMENGHVVGVLGFQPGSDFRRVGFVDSWQKGLLLSQMFFAQLPTAFSSVSKARENTGSVIVIAAITHSAVQKGFGSILFISAQLSIGLFIFNLLPIPILDGGYLLLFLVEALRRGRKLTEQQQQAYMLTGLVCIVLIFFMVMSNDILKLVNHQLPKLQ